MDPIDQLIVEGGLSNALEQIAASVLTQAELTGDTERKISLVHLYESLCSAASDRLLRFGRVG